MGTYNDINPNAMDMAGWQTVFFDGFNGTSLDYTKWPITYGGSMYWNNAFWWDNGQNSVGNGELTIGMDRLDNGIWAVGGLTTMPYEGAPAGHGNSFLYGRVEIRAKTSVEVEGAGPCFLLWPSTTPGLRRSTSWRRRRAAGACSPCTIPALAAARRPRL
jgi:beta-glucanase (GH16 family)